MGFVALYVMARDADQGENGRVTYRIQSGNTGGTFSLSPNTGKSAEHIQEEAQSESVEIGMVDGFVVGLDWYGIFGADADTRIREQENSDFRYIGW